MSEERYGMFVLAFVVGSAGAIASGATGNLVYLAGAVVLVVGIFMYAAKL